MTSRIVEELQAQISEAKASEDKVEEQIDQLRAEFEASEGGLLAQRRSAHERLNGLRQRLGSITAWELVNEAAETDEQWAQLWHERLQAAWARHGVEIPAVEELRPKLQAGRQIIADLEQVDYLFENRMGFLLVPPITIYGQPGEYGIQAEEQLLGYGDEEERLQELIGTDSSDEWKLLVTLDGDDAYTVDLARYIESGGMIAGYDTRAMGITEYGAMALQYQRPPELGVAEYPPEIRDFIYLTKYAKSHIEDVVEVCYDGEMQRYQWHIDPWSSGLEVRNIKPAVEITDEVVAKTA